MPCYQLPKPFQISNVAHRQGSKIPRTFKAFAADRRFNSVHHRRCQWIIESHLKREPMWLRAFSTHFYRFDGNHRNTKVKLKAVKNGNKWLGYRVPNGRYFFVGITTKWILWKTTAKLAIAMETIVFVCSKNQIIWDLIQAKYLYHTPGAKVDNFYAIPLPITSHFLKKKYIITLMKEAMIFRFHPFH